MIPKSGNRFSDKIMRKLMPSRSREAAYNGEPAEQPGNAGGH